ncbi:uncharacterized protein PG986_001848 [Apiospora aurea]|uniref:Ketoreductase (KR) domain-containing protein n=1 Tax=Apiospora aurea TaxID=335848 RepID=A0ABR1QXZ9_9PEZI
MFFYVLEDRLTGPFSNIVLIAAVRDVEGAQGLLSVLRGEGTQMHVVKIDSASRTDPFAAVMELQEKRGVNHLDVVVSSAGIVRLRATEQLPLDKLEEVLRLYSILSTRLF